MTLGDGVRVAQEKTRGKSYIMLALVTESGV